MITFIKIMWWFYVVMNIIYIPVNLFVGGYEKDTRKAVWGTLASGLALVFYFAIRPYLPF